MGRPFGIPVFISPTWLIIAALITFAFAPQAGRIPGIGAGRYLVAFVFAVLLYASVFVHELSHALVARGFGLPVRRITLHVLGGVSEIETEPQTPLREFLIAFAGPMLSLVLGFIGLGLHQVLPGYTVAGLLAYALASANLIVAVFNLLPGLPLDGGRMLRAGVWKVTGRPDTGTVGAAWAGRGLGVLVFLTPFVIGFLMSYRPAITSVVWAAVVGSFIWVGASQSLRTTTMRARLPRVSARTLARPAVPVPATMPLAEALRQAGGGPADAAGLVVVDNAGTPIALADWNAVGATPEHRRPWVTVGTMSRTLQVDHTISADLTGADLLTAMRDAPAPWYLLVESDGRVYGVLAAGDVNRAVAGS